MFSAPEFLTLKDKSHYTAWSIAAMETNISMNSKSYIRTERLEMGFSTKILKVPVPIKVEVGENQSTHFSDITTEKI